MKIVYKYRVYPTKNQAKIIDEQLEICRQVYNKTLNRKKSAYQENKTQLSLYDLQKELTYWKKENLEFLAVYSQILCSVQERVDLAYQGFFRRLKMSKPGEKVRFPKEKEIGRLRSLTYPQSGFKFLSKAVKLSKIGKIKAVFHRELVGDVKRLSLVKYASGKFFICVVSEVGQTAAPSVKPSNSVGIDLGCSHFAVLSDGKVFDSPKPLKKGLKNLSKAQSKGKDCSKIHEKVANRRSDFLHKLANKIVQNYDYISVENLDVKKMSKKRKGFSSAFRRAILDNGWSNFIAMLKYKAVIAGKHVILVDPSYTSQDCSKCGNRKKLELSERSYHCSMCGLLIDRDLNASHNILRLGMQSLGVSP